MLSMDERRVAVNGRRRKLSRPTRTESGGSIKYKITDIDNIQFGTRHTLIDGELNNAMSTKQNFQGELIVLARKRVPDSSPA